MSNRNRQIRRGVVLLIVLGMLAMFGLIGVTFILLSGHARRSAQAQAKVGRNDNPPDRIADDVLKQILRGSTDRASVIGPHSLLEDIYGLDAAELLPVNGRDDDGANGIDDAGEAGLTFGIFHDSPLPVPIVNGQLIEIMLAIPDISTAVITDQINVNPLQYIGCTLTMVNGPAAGQSTRIVGYNTTTGAAQILAFDNISAMNLINAIGDYFKGDDGIINTADDGTIPFSYVINGTPFSGTGFGYNPNAAIVPGNETDPLLTAQDPIITQPYALLPNPRAFTPTAVTYEDPAGPGGANEDYDAADYQNMLLACVVPQPGGAAPIIPIPSLHRPALVNYWFNRLAANPAIPTFFAGSASDKQVWFNDVDAKIHGTTLPLVEQQFITNYKRRILLRPLNEDHPDFTGSNSNYYSLWDGNTTPIPYDVDLDGTINAGEQIYPQWDVDNDGDGVMDSIWVDVGLPVRTTSDGRQYKPLAAILCLDMDGRLNLNAHGCLAQAAAYYAAPEQIGATIVPDASGIPVSQLDVPRGQGVGPAEVNLAALPPLANPLPLFAGNGTVPGRYSADNQPGRIPTAALSAFDYPPADPLAANKFYDYPGLYNVSQTFDPATNSGTMSYGTPVDLMGGVAVGLDLRGQPLYVAHDTVVTNLGQFIGGNPNVGLRADNPYELNLSGSSRGITSGSSDTPFAPSELEAVLRPYDIDTNMLPARLTTLAPDLAQHRYEVTTESWSLPCPAISIPPELRANANVKVWFQPQLYKANNLADLVRAKLVEADPAKFNNPSDPIQINDLETLVSALLPAEMRAGLKMDLNRPFGNGIDDNVAGDPGYGVIDEADEVNLERLNLTLNGIDDDRDGTVDEPDEVTAFYPVHATADPNNDNITLASSGGSDTNDQPLARQLYARNLYVMMLLLLNHDGADADVAREVAQWAVNVVDFRDRDSIMTAFEYDVNPFDGWDFDGDPSTDASGATLATGAINPNVVWGCERPELLITETLAFHDRRTQNLSAGGGLVGSGSDTDFDQQYRPEGSLFVELHNPWTENESLPGELCETVDGHKGIYLRKKASDDESPVWRMIIVDKTNTDDPDDPTLASPVPIERSVYFIEPGTNFVAAMGTTDGERFYPDTLPELSVLKPGRYAVIGPGKGTATSYTTYVGFRDGVPIPNPPKKIEEYNDPQNLTRRIVLTPSTDADTQQVEVYGDGEVNDLASLDIQSAIAVVINPEPFGGNATKPQRLSVSEPVGGYPACPGPGETYFPAQFQPLDYDSTLTPSAEDRTAKMATGTTSQYRWIYLQRLANPLQPYDEHSNPYRSIDKAQVDLTAFNGMADDTADQIVTTATAATPDLAFFTRERGEDEESQATDPNKPNNIWAVELSDDEPKAIDVHKVLPAQTHRFNEKFAHTLGYLNEGFGDPLADPSGSGIYDGRPNMPFPWLTWLNRPFLSEMEMMLVPKQRSSQLLNKDPADADKDKFFYPTASFSAANPYEDPGPNADQVYEPSQPYGHLINFFYDDTDPTGNPNRKLHRLLEFVRVPSPFVGTQLQGDPTAFSAGVHDFHPPFNRISERRDPGRVNLNTIASEEVFNGLLGDFTGPTWGNLVQSRGGDGITSMFDMNQNLPTRFANPFRSYAGKYMVPDIPALQNIIESEVDATMLRPMPGGSNDPLFNHNPSVDSPVNNTDRNPAFRYQLFNRLGSTATTRSNVYGVWITVGYFEVEPVATPDTNIYPDGYRLGQELGSDTGDITRHRSFYMIDRSIPVGFKRGEDLNTEDAVILRRFIE